MRKTTKYIIEPFDIIQQPPTKRLANINLKQPLLQYQKREKQRKKQLCYGLKDLCTNIEQQQNDRQKNHKNIIPIIDPNSKILIFWNILVGFAILFNFFMATLVVSFTRQAYIFDMNSTIGLTLNGISITVLYLDLVIRFNLAYFSRQKLIINRKQIILNYLKFQFWFDFISIICVTIYMSAGRYQLCYVRLGIYFRFFGLIKIDQAIILSLSLYKYVLSMYKLFRMVTITWLFTTWAACIFFAIDYSYYTDPNSTYNIENQLWLTNSEVVDGLDIIASFPQWYIWYEYALYWSIQTSATTGYGVITPKNPQQIMYCNFVMLLMTVLFAYFINYVWSIIRQVQQTSAYNENWYKLQQQLTQLSLSSDEKDKISNYMKQIYQDDQIQQIQTFITQNISKQLKDQYYIATKLQFYKQTLFRELFGMLQYGYNNGLLNKFVYLLEQCRMGKEQVVYLRGELDDSLYFVKSGYIKLEINNNNNVNIGRSVKKNQIFGALQFFLCKQRYHNAYTISFVKLWKLSYSDMKKCIKQDRIVNEIYCKLQEQIKIYGQLQKIEVEQCWRCGIFGHNTNKCQLTCYQPPRYDKVHKNKRKQSSIDQYLQYNQNVIRRQKINRKKILNKKVHNNILKQQHINIDCIMNFIVYRKQYNVENY